MKVRLTLEYDLAEGWLAPFIAGLREGKAVAVRCAGCDRVSFPPARVCGCGGRHADWITLDGTARIIWRATGTDGDFALVRFDGAATASVARVQNVPDGETAARLSPAGPDHRGLLVVGIMAWPTS